MLSTEMNHDTTTTTGNTTATGTPPTSVASFSVSSDVHPDLLAEKLNQPIKPMHNLSCGSGSGSGSGNGTPDLNATADPTTMPPMMVAGQQPVILPPTMAPQGMMNAPMVPQMVPAQPMAPMMPAQQLPPPPPPPTGLNLFVAGLLPETTSEELRKVFEPYGEIESTKVMLDTRTGTSRGFGFVLFAKSEDGNKALNALNNTNFGTSRLYISISQHDGKVEESQRLYIRNIPLGVPEEDIRSYFMQFGETTMFLLREGNGSFGADGSRHTQHLTIQYVSLEDAKKALTTCHGSTPFPGSTSPILAKYSEVTHTRQNNRRPPGGVRSAQGHNMPPPPMYQPPQPMMMQPMMYAPVMQPNGQAMMQPMMMMQPQPMMVPAGQPMMMAPMMPAAPGMMMKPQDQQQMSPQQQDQQME